MKNNKLSDEEFAEKLQHMMRVNYGKDLPKEHLLHIMNLTKLMLDVMQDSFVCSNCKQSYKVVFLNRNQNT